MNSVSLYKKTLQCFHERCVHSSVQENWGPEIYQEPSLKKERICNSCYPQVSPPSNSDLIEKKVIEFKLDIIDTFQEIL